MNDHNLDDLIIDNEEPRNAKTKTALTIITLLIVMLIVAIVLTKIVLKDPNAEQIALEENNTELISPELTLQNITEDKAPKDELNLSNIIEEEIKAPKLPAQEESIKPESTTHIEATDKTVETATEAVATTSETEVNTVEPKKETVEASGVKETVKTTVPAETKIIEKAKAEPAKRPVNIPASKSVVSGSYYIQVGSFTKSPSTQFLSIIKNSGFNYKISPATNSGTKKLLIGPYQSKKDADTALIRVKDRINKSAFVVKK